MNVSVHEWERIVEVLYRTGIVEAIELDEVFHIDNQPILNGVFAVPKSGTPAPGECRVTRLIMNLVPTNALQKLMPGDLPTLSGSCNWSSIMLQRGEVLLWSGDDQKVLCVAPPQGLAQIHDIQATSSWTYRGAPGS